MGKSGHFDGFKFEIKIFSIFIIHNYEYLNREKHTDTLCSQKRIPRTCSN